MRNNVLGWNHLVIIFNMARQVILLCPFKKKSLSWVILILMQGPSDFGIKMVKLIMLTAHSPFASSSATSLLTLSLKTLYIEADAEISQFFNLSG